MDLSNIQPAVGAVKSKTRIGRGAGSGKGGTSTRGHKGAKSRSGYSRKIGFEGGRLPKFGFKNINRVEYKAINISDLETLATAKNLQKIGLAELREAGLVSKNQLVKILANGSISCKVEVEANAFSEAAQKAIEAAGGSINKV